MSLTDNEVAFINNVLMEHVNSVEEDLYGYGYIEGMGIVAGLINFISEKNTQKVRDMLKVKNTSAAVDLMNKFYIRNKGESISEFTRRSDSAISLVNTKGLTNEQIADKIKQDVLDKLNRTSGISSVIEQAEEILKGADDGNIA